MRVSVAGSLFLAAAAVLVSQSSPHHERVGALDDGGFLLNSGWKLKPAGKPVQVDTFPMASALSKDGKYLLVLNGGYRPPSISVLRADTMQETSRTPVNDAWLGLTFAPDGKHVYVGGGSRASVYEFTWTDGKLESARAFQIVAEDKRTPADFIGDVTVSPDGRMLYAAGLYHNAIYVINLQSGRVIEKFATGRRPYRILVHPDSKSYFVTSWADGSLYHHNAVNGQKLDVVRLGQHPTDIVWRPRKADENGEEQAQWTGRLFVAAANTNNVYAVGVSESKDLKMIESINVAMTSRQPAGMTPTALAMNADQSRLFVVCSDVNATAVVDISEPSSLVIGFIPTGWYPTAVRTLADGRLVLLNGRGLRSLPSPKGPDPGSQAGTLSVIPPFNDEVLETYTKTVRSNSPYRDEQLDRANVPTGNPVPARPGDPSPIQHVIYIVKESRTYDQILGDLGKGNGEPSLAKFGEKITPNHHKLAREFVLLDNFYTNGDSSADGRSWSTSAIASDYVQKMWPNSAGERRKQYDYEGGEPAALPPAGYLWTNAVSAGLTIRNYGWWATNLEKPADGHRQIERLRDPLLAKYTNLNYRAFDLDYKDIDRAKVFLSELQDFEKTGSMPKLMFLRLGNDQTSGTAAAKIAPSSAMADNDAALGMIVDAVSKSKFWPQTAIFVLEADAHDGPDHVDSHRSPAFILSPYTRRGGFVDSSMYNTMSMLRTMELIVGLRPLTTFDAAARPMWNSFSTKPDTSPYTAEAARISLDEKNPGVSAAAAQSHDIPWRASRNSEPSAPVRSYLSR